MLGHRWGWGVPHALGLLPGLEPFYVDEEHSALPGNQKVLAALDELLETGETSRLSRDKPPKKSGWFRGEPQAQIEEARRQDKARLSDLARQLQSRSAAPDASAYVSPQERKAGEILMRDSIPLVEGWDGHLGPASRPRSPRTSRLAWSARGSRRLMGSPRTTLAARRSMQFRWAITSG